MASIFTKIVNREIPGTFLHEDELCAAIVDIHPMAPTHVLVFPKKEIRSISDANPKDQMLMGHLLLVCTKVAGDLGLDKHGYRLVTNNGVHGGQTVDHLHIHILGGHQLSGKLG